MFDQWLPGHTFVVLPQRLDSRDTFQLNILVCVTSECVAVLYSTYVHDIKKRSL